MVQALRALFGSKKFLTLMIGLLVAAGARFGLQLDGETAALIIGFFAVLVGAQGAADFGKEAASKVVCPNCSAASSPPPAATSPSASNTAVMLLAVLAGLTLATSPACGGSSRQTQLRHAMTALGTASDAFVAFDRAHQQAIVDKAISLEEGTSRLDAYKATRARVVESFEVAYHAIAAAAVLSSDRPSLAKALAATEIAIQTWFDLKGRAP